MEETKEKACRYPTISAVVDASFTVPDLLHVVEAEEGAFNSPSDGSCSSFSSCQSPTMMSGRSTEGSPSPAGLDSPDGVFRSPKSPGIGAACRSPILVGRRAIGSCPSEASSLSPAGLDSPDCVFRSPKLVSKFGLFSALKGRRSSAPLSQQSPRREVRFKSDLLAIPEQNPDRRWSASASHEPIRIVVSSSDAEFGRGRCGGGGKLRKRREFGSTGDLLEGSAQFNGSVKHFLGKSMEQVSCSNEVRWGGWAGLG